MKVHPIKLTTETIHLHDTCFLTNSDKLTPKLSRSLLSFVPATSRSAAVQFFARGLGAVAAADSETLSFWSADAGSVCIRPMAAQPVP